MSRANVTRLLVIQYAYANLTTLNRNSDHGQIRDQIAVRNRVLGVTELKRLKHSTWFFSRKCHDIY